MPARGLGPCSPEVVAEAARRFGPDVVYVPVIAEEGERAEQAGGAGGHPARHSGATISTDIVQASRAFHTGANAMERLVQRATFEGPVEAALCDGR